MIELEWVRTVIGGDELAYDFCAKYQGIIVGRNPARRAGAAARAVGLQLPAWFGR